jgi:hypothetical protein
MNEYIQEVLDAINNREVTVHMMTGYGSLLIERCEVVDDEETNDLIFYRERTNLRLKVNRIQLIEIDDNIIKISLDGLEGITVYCLGK